jgi:hypothetical protein
MTDPTGPSGVGDADDSAARPSNGAAREQEWAMGETAWAAAEEYAEPAGGRAIPAFLSGALAGIVVLGLIWAGTAYLRDVGAGTQRAATTPVTSTATTNPKPPRQFEASGPASRENRCRQADAALAAPLRAAAPALDQWEIHVGAMNKLVVGAITPQQAAAFWSQTRAGAERNLADFYSATRRARSATAACPSPRALSQAPRALKTCAQHVVREEQALETARIAMRTWRTHIRHMKMLDMGHLSPEAATQLWLANWQQGIRELRSFRSATRAIDGPATC